MDSLLKKLFNFLVIFTKNIHIFERDLFYIIFSPYENQLKKYTLPPLNKQKNTTTSKNVQTVFTHCCLHKNNYEL